MGRCWRQPRGRYLSGGGRPKAHGKTRKARSLRRNTLLNLWPVWIGPWQSSTNWINLLQKSGTIVSSHLTVSQNTELLERLKVTLRDVATTEEKLNQDFRSKTDIAERRFREDSETQEAEAAAQISREESRFESAKAKLRSKYEQRKTRIGRAQQSSKRRTLEWVEHHEGREKYTAQKGLLDTERGRVEGLKQNDTALADYESQLAEDRQAFVELEQTAEKAFRGYRRFRRLITDPVASPEPDLSPAHDQLLEQLRQVRTRTADDLAR